MAAYIVRRLVLFVPTLIAMSLVVFSILALAPGDPLTRYEQALQTTYNYSAEAAQQRTDLLRERYGIDQPFVARYATWLGQFVTGDFGVSFENFQPVADLVEWAKVAANSEPFARKVVLDYWRLLIGEEPLPGDETELTRIAHRLSSEHEFRVERMLADLVTTEAYGAP